MQSIRYTLRRNDHHIMTRSAGGWGSQLQAGGGELQEGAWQQAMREGSYWRAGQWAEISQRPGQRAINSGATSGRGQVAS